MEFGYQPAIRSFDFGYDDMLGPNIQSCIRTFGFLESQAIFEHWLTNSFDSRDAAILNGYTLNSALGEWKRYTSGDVSPQPIHVIKHP